MRIAVKSSTGSEYTGQVTFAGYIGSENEYTVYANNEDEAEDLIRDMASEDLSVDDIEDQGDGEWEVTISFAGMIGVEETYSVYEDDEDDTATSALEEAKWDLEVEFM